MTWQPEVDEIERRRAIAREMGGEEAVARHHERGELTLRERLDGLLDDGSYREYGVLSGSTEYSEEGELTGFTPSNAIVAIGKLGGRDIVVGGEDATIRGGASDGG
ncbi:MAG: carboxyl transferase domain-containing protein, partial [Dehalococcoidia bacterium]|nr:carboxyl transferase domain-containing protein [Dehalococcoidia bacterium]